MRSKPQKGAIFISISRKIKKHKIKELLKWFAEVQQEQIYRRENNICDYCDTVGTNFCSCNRYMCNEHFDFSRNICGYCCDNLDN